MPGRLTVHFSDRPVRRESLLEGHTYVIGREPSCDIPINAPELSRRHARLVWNDDGPTIEDLGSKNGLSIDGKPVKRASLPNSAWISIGNLLARFERISDAELNAEQAAGRKRWEDSMIMRKRLDSTHDMEQLLHESLDSVIALSGTQRGFVLLAQRDGTLEIKCRAGTADTAPLASSFAGSVGAVNLALESGEPVVSCDALQDDSIGGRPSVVTGGIRALVCLPLKVLDKTTGAVYADSTTPGKVFTSLDVEILQEMVAHAALVLAAAHLREELEGLGQIVPAIDPERTDSDLLKPWRDRIPAVASDQTGLTLASLERPPDGDPGSAS